MQQPQNAITWFTQPARSFASFYYYDTHSKTLVRIRLELGRSPDGDGGSTGAFLTPNRHVGFFKASDTEAFLNAPSNTFGVNNSGAITVNAPQQHLNQTLSLSPQQGLVVCDFSGTAPVHLDDVHIGNQITTTPHLPNGINIAILEQVAQKAITSGTNITLTDPGASEGDLAAAIIKASK